MELKNLDFIPSTETSKSVGQIPLPDEMPRRPDMSQLPRDILKSSTVENLLSQNEDLMARLKVSLRRLSILEIENQKLAEETQRSRLAQSSAADQLLVLKEKDQVLKGKIDIIEKDKDIYAEKFRLIHEKHLRTLTELERYQKYHDRIKQQVKPYIAQLKQYSKTQETQNTELTQDLERKEAQLRDLRHQMIELAKNSRSQIEILERKNHEMTQFYETQIEKMQSENQVLRENQQELGLKTLKLNKALERQDQLENELVEISRSKEDLRQQNDKEVRRLQERTNELTRHNQKLGIEHADLQVRVVSDQERIFNFEKENGQLQQQLESLRYMWTAKNEETERLRSAMSSLEKLNLELSQKMNDLRQNNEESK